MTLSQARGAYIDAKALMRSSPLDYWIAKANYLQAIIARRTTLRSTPRR